MIIRAGALLLLTNLTLPFQSFAQEVELSDSTILLGNFDQYRGMLTDSVHGAAIIGDSRPLDGSSYAASRKMDAGTPAVFAGAQGGRAFAKAVSADGTFIVGEAQVGNAFRATVWNTETLEPVDLGTLDGGSSVALALAQDGSVIVGEASLSNGYSHAVSWTRGSTTPIDLGTLGGASSSAQALSADGAVIVGKADLASGYYHAASWVDGSTTATDLGTLGGGFSEARAVSADGRVIVGQAWTSAGDMHAAFWVDGSVIATDLGTLGGSVSDTRALSADGRVIVGQAQTAAGDMHAASWVDGSVTATDLGTLGGTYSDAIAVSADGSVIAGMAHTAVGVSHAAVWRSGATLPTDLGTLGGVYSDVASISADGSIIVGSAQKSDGSSHAVFWAGEATLPIELGSLDGISSSVSAISADGTVVVGTITTPSNETHATIWKLVASAPPPSSQPSVPPVPPDTTLPPPDATMPEPHSPVTDKPLPPSPLPEAGPVPKPVGIDVTNTAKTVASLANDTFSVIQSQRRGLDRLQRSCDVTKAGESCYSVSVDIGRAGDTTDALGWIAAAHAFTDNFLAGVTVAHSISRDLPGDFDRNNTNIGGGIHARWQDKTTTGNWYLRGAIAANRYDTTRTRRKLGYTEAGTGESTITGWGASLELGQSFDLANRAVLGYYGGLRYSDLKMDGYTETGAYFPFSYSDVKSKRTTAYLGADYAVPLTERVRWSINAEIEQDLSHNDPVVVATADYIGALRFQSDAAHTRGSVSTTLSYRFSDEVSIGVTPYLARTVNRDAAYGAVIDVSGKF